MPGRADFTATPRLSPSPHIPMLRIATIALPIAVAVLACAPPGARNSATDGLGPGAMMLCVSNQSDAVGTIRVWVDDFRTHTVSSGRRVCKPIRNTARGAHLYAESIGGGLRGPVRYENELTGGAIRCWDWVLRDALASQIRLMPCRGS